MNVLRSLAWVLAVALAGCASPSRRIDEQQVKLFKLEEASIRSVRIVLVPVRDLQLAMAHQEAASGWNTQLFDERFGRRVAANFEANGVRAQYRGASGLEVAASSNAPADYLMTVEATRFSYPTRSGIQSGVANYGIRVSLYRRGTNVPLVVYEDGLTRGFQGTHDTIPDRFTYSFFNLLRDHGRWPTDNKIVLAEAR